MQREKGRAPQNKRNTIVKEGVHEFAENQTIISLAMSRLPLSGKDLFAGLLVHPKYHGPDRPECILVRKRKERTYLDHYLNIYCCLTHGEHVECLRSGWEVGWYGGTSSRNLS